jgi:hypothetical protein
MEPLSDPTDRSRERACNERRDPIVKRPMSRSFPGRVLVAFLTLACAHAVAHGQATAFRTPSRETQWHEDLNVFASEFAARQKDFTTLYPKARFEKELALLRQTASTGTDADVVFGLMRLVASAHVAHTTVNFPQGARGFRRVPLGLGWYSDGLAVVSASEAYRAALGARVVRIGDMAPEEVEAAVAPYVSYENEFWLHQQGPRYMTVVELLQRVGAAEASGHVSLTLANAGQASFVLDVAPVEPTANVTLASMYDVLPIPPLLYRKQLQRNYWFEYLPASRTIFFQYNRCQEDPALPFSQFSQQLFDSAAANPVDRLVIDLRLNQGGNSAVLQPFLAGLKARSSLRARGHLIALIGRATFSSGLIAAVSLKNDTGAVLIGEPTGEKPNSYGEVLPLTLPHSQLSVQYTTKFFRLAPSGDPIALFPDLTVTRSLDDALAGRDPALDAALRYQGR